MRVSLYQFQKDAVEFHLKHHYSLNLFEMGMGKTIIALAVAQKLGGNAVIVCPSFLMENWRREIEKFFRYEETRPTFHFVTYSQLSLGKVKLVRGVKTLIADEAHYLKNIQAKRTSAFLDMLIGLEPICFLGLTGTPIKNRVPEFYSLLAFISLNPKGTSGIDVNQYFTSYREFCDRYCESKINNYSAAIEYFGLKPEMKEEFRELLRGKVYKVSASKVLDLPPITHVRHYAEVGELVGLESDYFKGADSAAKALAASNKALKTCEYVQNLSVQGSGPIVIFTDHINAAELIAKELGTRAITGAMPNERRLAIMDGFVKDGGFLVATIGSFSVGVNLVNSCHLVFNDLSWVPANNLQALKRVHRIGQERHCMIHYVLSGPVDERILDSLQNKMLMIDSTNEMAFQLTEDFYGSQRA